MLAEKTLRNKMTKTTLSVREYLVLGCIENKLYFLKYIFFTDIPKATCTLFLNIQKAISKTIRSLNNIGI